MSLAEELESAAMEDNSKAENLRLRAGGRAPVSVPSYTERLKINESAQFKQLYSKVMSVNFFIKNNDKMHGTYIRKEKKKDGA